MHSTATILLQLYRKADTRPSGTVTAIRTCSSVCNAHPAGYRVPIVLEQVASTSKVVVEDEEEKAAVRMVLGGRGPNACGSRTIT
jgi:hypothetical protein